MITSLVALLGATSISCLFAGGFVLGARRGRLARHQLLAAHAEKDATIESLRGEIAARPDGVAREDLDQAIRNVLGTLTAQQREDAEGLRADLEAALRRAVGAVSEQKADARGLREEIHRAIRPLVERDRDELGHALRTFETHGLADLPRLLDVVATRGGFAAVVLCDDVGLPLGASAGATDVDVLAGVSSLVLTLADRSASAGSRPLSVLLHDDANRMILHRIFSASGARFVLTAVSRGRSLSTEALEPAIGKLEVLLARRAA